MIIVYDTRLNFTICIFIFKALQLFCDSIYSLPHEIFVDWFKVKAFADDKINEAEKKNKNFVLERVENIVGKGENAGY